ncbi:MAG: RluA family pseudouridine synthase, partial [Enterococcus sp.]|nr:RluA family pseudouridine synthase [Enterococcus sp.]
MKNLKFIVSNSDNQRIDKWLIDQGVDISRSVIQKLISDGNITVNGKSCEKNTKLKDGDNIEVTFEEEKETEIIPQHFDLDIVYEDDDVLVVNKEAGMVVHPGHGNFEGTLVNALAHYLGITPCEEDEEGDDRMGILVHRIDKDTSGLLVVAKQSEAQLRLAKQFFDHSIDRRYVAVVWGNIREDEGTIDTYIGRDPSDRLKYRVFNDPDRGKHAVTHYRVLERFGYVTVVECKLETGRTHQISVH